MTIMNYGAWYAEASHDPHADFAPVLTTYRADADNAATFEANASATGEAVRAWRVQYPPSPTKSSDSVARVLLRPRQSAHIAPHLQVPS